ncbi:MAG: SsrA-binding protein SmpB [Planctomycetes bacterium]|nr:SsrA-binding protein SmpB [Planctomycetota bacterium]
MARDRDKKSRQIPKMVNKKAFRDYEIVEKVEAGLVLCGSEVKSLRAGGADLNGSFARLLGDECWLVGCNIAIYAQAGDNNHEPSRKRKLLLHKRQITKIATRLTQRGFTLVPLRIFFNERGLAKIEIALAKGKRKYDKRDKITQHQQKKDINRYRK